ncbi:hypothetical protein BJ912DRAFT_1062919 [Pholiota molesta]|nr:hypothetical protein BJ912DRAFT_1062919 [Pholiota molesta]
MPAPLRPQRSPSVNSFGWSIFSNSENNPKMVQPRDVKRHLPKHTEDYIKAYMANDTFFDTKRAVSLWKPSPSDKSEAWTWKHHIYVGDVGIFNDEGGFDTIFNIFISKDENLALGYDPPSDFICYPKSLDELNLDYTRINYRDQPHKALKLNGIDSFSQKKQSNESSTDSSPINSTYRANGTSDCSAIYLESGYYKIPGNNISKRLQEPSFTNTNFSSLSHLIERKTVPWLQATNRY